MLLKNLNRFQLYLCEKQYSFKLNRYTNSFSKFTHTKSSTQKNLESFIQDANPDASLVSEAPVRGSVQSFLSHSSVSAQINKKCRD